jgi:hypothetical protein
MEDDKKNQSVIESSWMFDKFLTQISLLNHLKPKKEANVHTNMPLYLKPTITRFHLCFGSVDVIIQEARFYYQISL